MGASNIDHDSSTANPSLGGRGASMTPHAHRIPVPLAALHVTGADARKFLQGQLTNDLDRLERAGHLIAAVCTPDGKLVTIVRLESHGVDQLHLITYHEHLDRLLGRLNRFKLRVKAELEPVDAQWFVVDDDDVTSPLWPLDARHLEAGPPAADDDLTAFTRLRLARSALHLPTDAPPELLVAGVPSLVDQGVSFTKGCYVGQELVARTDSRGAPPPVSVFVVRFTSNDAPSFAALEPPLLITTEDGDTAGEARGLLTNGTDVILSGWVKRRWFSVAGLRLGPNSPAIPVPLR